MDSVVTVKRPYTSDDERLASLDRYTDAGVIASVGLVNALALGHAGGKPLPASDARLAIARVLAVDPPSVAQLTDAHGPGFTALARRLHDVFSDLHVGDVDRAASRLNGLLVDHPAHPHLAKEDGRWRLHHHPVDVALVPMWTSICAEGMARMIGSGWAERLGMCDGTDCDRVFVDVSKNASRRFCSTTCQNRVKAASFRLRRVSSR